MQPFQFSDFGRYLSVRIELYKVSQWVGLHQKCSTWLPLLGWMSFGSSMSWFFQTMADSTSQWKMIGITWSLTMMKFYWIASGQSQIPEMCTFPIWKNYLTKLMALLPDLIRKTYLPNSPKASQRVVEVIYSIGLCSKAIVQQQSPCQIHQGSE